MFGDDMLQQGLNFISMLPKGMRQQALLRSFRDHSEVLAKQHPEWDRATFQRVICEAFDSEEAFKALLEKSEFSMETVVDVAMKGYDNVRR